MCQACKTIDSRSTLNERIVIDSLKIIQYNVHRLTKEEQEYLEKLAKKLGL